MQKTGVATIEVFNVLGSRFYHNDMYCHSGLNKLVFNGQDLVSGVYLYRLCTSDYLQIKKMIFMK